METKDISPDSTRNEIVAKLIAERDTVAACEHDHETAILLRLLRQGK